MADLPAGDERAITWARCAMPTHYATHAPEALLFAPKPDETFVVPPGF
ncbi:hypothetical protein [Ornithinimicrobium sp. INDO-MA30-4]|nr:hypothetical protein [Ornithinimicrobium sp. INDO-MA30-4]UJH71171.1 hypothetical protein L0A91_04870 [Ornithinimicrobium sp. INDO-MA30-4]